MKNSKKMRHEHGTRNLSLSLSSYFFNFLTVIHLLQFTLINGAFSIIPKLSNETDRLALLQFKARITDDPLGVMSSWNNSYHFCRWYGITCGSKHQRVTILDLRTLKLSGSISPHIGNLSFLRELYLENNAFRSEIPPQIGRLRRLQVLFLPNNLITGKIPTNLSSCSNLESLVLRSNNLEGDIPLELINLTKLRVISLGTNNLTGTISPSLANLSFLETFIASENKLHGVLPESWGNLISLRTLGLAINQLSGLIPSSIFNISLIQAIDLGTNDFHGFLPVSLVDSVPQIEYLSLSSNQFTGSIPTSISNASNLELFQVNSNNLTGAVPSLEKLNKLVVLGLSHNHLGSGKADDLSFLFHLTNATVLKQLFINDNNYGGELPDYIANFSKTITTINFARNRIHGQIPNEIDLLFNLKVFTASENLLSGKIPSTIGKVMNLQKLHLRHNNFGGTIPFSVGNLTNLIELRLQYNDLQGMIPSSIGNCSNLLELALHHNNLTGPIPRQIFRISSLTRGLYLSFNRLNGSLADEVSNLKQLGMIFLEHNLISDEIPTGLGSCISLVTLSLSNNFFQGSIPSSLSSLRGLTVLDLSYNNLSGQIPQFLEGFILLQWLNLSYNDFEGIVPTKGIFENGTVINLQGNNKLCGGISDLGLSACESEEPKSVKEKRRKVIIVSVSISASLLLAACLLIWLSRKRKEISIILSSFENEMLRLTYQNLLKATNEFSSENLIGSGGFGSVYKGVLEQDGLIIAVKVVNLMHRGASKSFLAECEVLRNVRHRNLVKVLTTCSGVDYRGNDFKALVYEFMDNGNLHDWLHPTYQKNLNIDQRLNIAIDVASALEYLHNHSGTLPIVHCDLKPSNILLDKEMTAHVGDFGLVKFLSSEISQSSTGQSNSLRAIGTIGYCPPEYGLGTDASTSGDVFSFGILLLEMFTGKRPTDDIFKDGLSLHNFVERALPEQVIPIIDPNLQLREDANHILIECLISIFEIGISCSSESPQERLNIDDVVAQLSSIRRKVLGTRPRRGIGEVASTSQMTPRCS
ncbi:probable LRR receptor-like serine/threonine-protein kinase At3g47570 [Mercurialis annua]|uniref:probable LRR receptor-like serine/threonine-protein kinase At3g47570 n=1 Tax=Mercurialis annua TaxID=3986 RepID=UPI00215F4069|nr:probable LRR receptor-like serine/threonine-protein kinase At3g47570 [Mercurialis annua]XP_055962075.1 probable LRR receptor-like serine/threonine-protein kinase At3g47570 [Mercurialis annua]XP_055962076.1 probable LRR receptor-like serine/threonine-protein kinase At3g47570 [Mercurialis annua]